LSWEGDEPSATVAEEDSAPAAEESTPAPQAETEAPALEATLPEAGIVEAEYTARTQFFSRSSRGRRERLIRISSVDRG
jgi:Mrp family chromosome partitioning ATPase